MSRLDGVSPYRHLIPHSALRTPHLLLFLVFMAVVAQGAVFNSGFANSGVVPDGNPAGWSDTRTVSGVEGAVSDVNVRFTVSGGYNGDLYVYLAHGGQSAVLLNRVGRTTESAFGYGNAGMSVTFNEQAGGTYDIHFYQSQSGYSISDGTEWRPDGRVANPASVVGTEARTGLLGSFNGLDAGGSWTLFVADLSGGGVAQVTEWGLDISTVPEPVTVALGVFGAIAAIIRFKGKGRR